MLATLLTRNPNRDDEERRDIPTHGPSHRGPNQNKWQDYNEENSEDEKYAEGVLGNQHGPAKDNS